MFLLLRILLFQIDFVSIINDQVHELVKSTNMALNSEMWLLVNHNQHIGLRSQIPKDLVLQGWTMRKREGKGSRTIGCIMTCFLLVLILNGVLKGEDVVA